MALICNRCGETFTLEEYGESKDVLTINSMGVMRVMNFDGGNWCYPTMEPYASAFKITHWMPLPELPKEV